MSEHTYKPGDRLEILDTVTGRKVALPMTYQWYIEVQRHPKQEGRYNIIGKWEDRNKSQQTQSPATTAEAKSQSNEAEKKSRVAEPVEVKKEANVIDPDAGSKTVDAGKLTPQMVDDCNDVDHLKAWGKQVSAALGNTKSLSAIKEKIKEKL